MLSFNIPIIVEGKYDKARLAAIVSSTIIATHGFGVFNSRERQLLIRRLGRGGIIVLCDSDGGGRQIRSHLKGMLGGAPVYDLYIPQIKGKEKRKASPSKAGLLGVEGISNEILTEILEKFALSHPETVNEPDPAHRAPEGEPITKALLFELGLNGTANAASNRKKLCEALGLPDDMTVNGLYEALKLISSADEIRAIMNEK